MKEYTTEYQNFYSAMLIVTLKDINMTPKEKAKELANKFYEGNVFYKTKEEHLLECKKSKKYALIAVGEMIDMNIAYHGREISNNMFLIDYWCEVKLEIKKL